MIRTVIADDHELIRDGFQKLLSSEKDILLVGEAENAFQLLLILKENTVDVIVLDLHLPDRDGMEVLKEIRRQYKDVKILILSMHPEERYAARALKNGASGYLTKDTASDELVAAIRAVYRQGRYITSKTADILAETLQNASAEASHNDLSDREFQVLLSLGGGKSVTETAEELCLSINTVNSYRRRLLDKLGLHSTSDCIRYVYEHNLND